MFEFVKHFRGIIYIFHTVREGTLSPSYTKTLKKGAFYCITVLSGLSFRRDVLYVAPALENKATTHFCCADVTVKRLL